MSKQVRQKAKERRRLEKRLAARGRCLRCALVPDVSEAIATDCSRASGVCATCGRDVALDVAHDQQEIHGLSEFIRATSPDPTVCVKFCLLRPLGTAEPDNVPCDCGRNHVLFLIDESPTAERASRTLGDPHATESNSHPTN